MDEDKKQKMEEMIQAMKESAHLMLDEKSAPIYFKLEEISEHLKKIAEKEEMEMPETHKVEIQGVELLTIKGEKGDQGEKPTEEELVQLIKPLIPEPIKGEDGKDGKDGRNGIDGRDGLDGKDGLDGRDGKDGKDGSPDTAEQIVEKINSSEKKIDKERVEGLDEEFKEVRKEISSIPRGGGTSALAVARAFKYIAHTEQPTGDINGVNTTYTVKNTIWWIAGFTLNGEQIAELPNFTYSNKTITFSTALPADYSGKDFEIKYIGT